MRKRAYIRQDRYEIIPWLEEYDQQMSSYIPYLMDLSTPNYTSEVLNTDNFGLRKGTLLGKKKFNNYLLGGSTTFGVGASSDFSTISSIITKSSNENWKNFGVRGYNGLQELLLFQAHILEINKNVKNIVIMSGINDIYLNLVGASPHILGPFFFGSSFERKLKRKKAIRVILEKIASFRLGQNPAIEFVPILSLLKSIINVSYFKKNYFTRYHSSDFSHFPDFKTLFERNIMLWNFISKGLNANIIFLLQPYADWTSKKLTNEEKQLFTILDDFQNKSWKNISNKIRKKEIHEEYKKILSQTCEKNKIRFFDLNDIFDENTDDEWAFVDRIHLTDSGNKIVAKQIMSMLY